MTDKTMETKRCISCDEIRPLDRFAMERRRNKPAKIRHVCKECTNATLRKKRAAKKAVHRLQAKEEAQKLSPETRMTDRELQRRLRAVEGMGY